jgi:F-type H+-transporting ATPase subunit delta
MENTMAKQLLMGNEAMAYAALEAGVRVAAGYPGTPSSEIIETIALMDNANEDYLIDQVYREFKERLDNGDLTISVDVTTAVPMGDELRAKVIEKCEQDFDRPVYLVEHVEPKIIGGIIIEARGHRRDA